MKKKNLFLATVIAVVGVSSLVFSRENISGCQFSDLELANIEALTRAENKAYLYVVKKEAPESAPGCACAGTGDKLCCDHPNFPGFDK